MVVFGGFCFFFLDLFLISADLLVRNMTTCWLGLADQKSWREASSLVSSLNGSVISACPRCSDPSQCGHLIWPRAGAPNLWFGQGVTWMGLGRGRFRPIRLSTAWSPGPLTCSGVSCCPQEYCPKGRVAHTNTKPLQFHVFQFHSLLPPDTITIWLALTCWTPERTFLAKFLWPLGVNSPLPVCHHDSTLFF